MPPSLPSWLHALIPAPSFPVKDHTASSYHPNTENNHAEEDLKTEQSPEPILLETAKNENLGNVNVRMNHPSMEDGSVSSSDPQHVYKKKDLTEVKALGKTSGCLLQECVSNSPSFDFVQDSGSLPLISSDEGEPPETDHNAKRDKAYFTLITTPTYPRCGYLDTRPYRPSISYQRGRLYTISEVDEDNWLRRKKEKQQQKKNMLLMRNPTLPHNSEPQYYSNVQGYQHGHFQEYQHAQLSSNGFPPGYIIPPPSIHMMPSHYNGYPDQHPYHGHQYPPTQQMGYSALQASPRPYDMQYFPPHGQNYTGGSPVAHVPMVPAYWTPGSSVGHPKVAPVYAKESICKASMTHREHTSGFQKNTSNDTGNRHSPGESQIQVKNDARYRQMPIASGKCTQGSGIELQQMEGMRRKELHSHQETSHHEERSRSRHNLADNSSKHRHTSSAIWGPTGHQEVNNFHFMTVHGHGCHYPDPSQIPPAPHYVPVSHSPYTHGAYNGGNPTPHVPYGHWVVITSLGNGNMV